MTTDLTHRLIVGVPQEAVRPGWTGTRGGLQILDEVNRPVLGLRDFRDSAQIMTADLFQNSFGHYPNLALIQGRDDKDSVIQPGSYHYLYVADSQSSTALSIHFSTHGYLVRLTFSGLVRLVFLSLVYQRLSPSGRASFDERDEHHQSRGLTLDQWNVDSETLTLTATWVNPSNSEYRTWRRYGRDCPRVGCTLSV